MAQLNSTPLFRLLLPLGFLLAAASATTTAGFSGGYANGTTVVVGESRDIPPSTPLSYYVPCGNPPSSNDVVTTDECSAICKSIVGFGGAGCCREARAQDTVKYCVCCNTGITCDTTTACTVTSGVAASCFPMLVTTGTCYSAG